MWVDSVSGRFGRLHNRQIIIISCYYHSYSYSYSYYSPFFLRTMNLSTADLRNYWTEFRETWWSYRYIFLVDPKVFRFVVNGVKAIFLGVQRGWGLLQNHMGIQSEIPLSFNGIDKVACSRSTTERACYIRKTADLLLQLWVSTFPRFVAIGFYFLS